MFKGILSKNSKVKVLTEVDGQKYASQYKAKFTSLVVSEKKVEGCDSKPLSHFVSEHCIAKFFNSGYLANFINVFESLASN